MNAITDLDELLATMRPELDPQAWVFISAAEALPGAVVTVTEREGVTSVVPAATAAAGAANSSASCARLTLTVHSDLEAVGLTAAIATALAEDGIPANVVAGYFHDHVFVPTDRAVEALAVLEALSARAGRRRAGTGD